ncbi:MAG: radical SAM protein [Myxococcales bacterium]|nr:radical SAM protein [Myxococcales bacterium]
MLAEFQRTYDLDHPTVIAALSPWTVSQVAISAIRSAIDLVLVAAARRLVVAIEARGAGAHLAATRDLQLSYYADDGVDHGAAAAVVRALATALAGFEAGAPPRRLPVVPSAGHRFVELRINRTCNERCRFCNTPADSPTVLDQPAEVYARIAAAAAAGCADLLLTGRETTLAPELPGYVAAARAAGIGNVRVQTNATTLGHGPVLAALLAAGVTEFEVSLHTLAPATFAALIGPAALLPHTVAGLDALAAAPQVGVTIVCVVTAVNLDEVPGLVATIATRWPGVRSLVLSPVAPVGDGADALELLVPYARLGPVIADGLRAAARLGLAATVPARCGLPPCALPADVRDRHEAVRSDRGGPIEPGKRKPAACATCALDRRCGGAWARYLDVHGDAGLAPI